MLAGTPAYLEARGHNVRGQGPPRAYGLLPSCWWEAVGIPSVSVLSLSYQRGVVLPIQRHPFMLLAGHGTVGDWPPAYLG